MLVPISNTTRPYAWGSTFAIAELLDRVPSGGPEAELWLGAHPGSPSRILDPSLAGGAQDLAEWIAKDPATTLGRFAGSGRLPFLLKVLAADSPLSLQAHPTPEQAVEGFRRENASAVPIDAPERNYKDDAAKPELIYAVSPTFDALCGFRPTAQVRDIVGSLLSVAGDGAERLSLGRLLDSLDSEDASRGTFEWLVSKGSGVPQLVTDVVELASQSLVLRDDWRLEFETVRELAKEYPGDPGIVISLLLNRVRLVQGEALSLAAGNIHAYLAGVGIELMTASDNVLRGGLTPKHIDVPELISVLDFGQIQPPYLHPELPAPSIEVFRPEVQDFVLVRFTGAAVWPIDAPAIVLCTGGRFDISGTAVDRGAAFFVTPDEPPLHISGTGTLFLATTGA